MMQDILLESYQIKLIPYVKMQSDLKKRDQYQIAAENMSMQEALQELNSKEDKSELAKKFDEWLRRNLELDEELLKRETIGERGTVKIPNKFVIPPSLLKSKSRVSDQNINSPESITLQGLDRYSSDNKRGDYESMLSKKVSKIGG